MDSLLRNAVVVVLALAGGHGGVGAMLSSRLLLLALIFLSGGVSASFTGIAAELPGFPGVPRPTEVRYVTPRLLIAPAQADGSSQVAIVFTIAPTWHLYWRNPGDTGLSPNAVWTLPPGWTADPLRFPKPLRHNSSDLISYIHEHELTLLTTLRPGPGVAAARLEGSVKLSWLVCSEPCVPGDATLALPAPNPAAAAVIAATEAQLPTPLPAGMTMTATASGAGAILTLAGQPLAQLNSAKTEFFPDQEGFFQLLTPLVFVPATANTNVGPRWTLTLHPLDGKALPARISGLVSSSASAAGWHVDIALTAASGAGGSATSPSTTAVSSPTMAISLAAAIVAGLIGGLILNLMPCVLPVLALKALGIARAQAAGQSLLRMALGYTAGVVATYVALALVLLALRAVGGQLGWGFQLQEPWVVIALAVLFLFLAANLVGLFEIGLSATQVDTRRGGSFMNGVLTTVVATPCGAPFASTALGYALVAPAAEAIAVFIAMGIGLAAPIILIAVVPGAVRWLPKPGAWMEDFKKILAVPMLAAAGWMLWTASALIGAEAAFIMMVVLVPTVALTALTYGRYQYGVRWALIVAVLAGVGVIGTAWWCVSRAAPHVQIQVAGWETWSPEREAALRASGKPYLIDYTAAWCLTCQINKRTTLHVAAVEQALAARGVTLLIADYTARDQRITAALMALGRASVPTYVFYSGSGEPAVLPDLLTPGLITDTIAGLPLRTP